MIDTSLERERYTTDISTMMRTGPQSLLTPTPDATNMHIQVAPPKLIQPTNYKSPYWIYFIKFDPNYLPNKKGEHKFCSRIMFMEVKNMFEI